MKVIELERKIQETAVHIKEARLIPQCIDIAIKLGKGGKTSNGDYANAHYYFSDDNLNIVYHAYGMGDEELTVTSRRNEVFKAQERVNEPVTYPNPEVEFDKQRFEVLFYRSGEWEKHVNTLYHKIVTDVPQEQLADVKQRLGIAISN
ncbi:hypothetical protein KW805_03925 [Candidatus Pacearchaeota archaeon]|nr:hypothetical protein [Candidatus Pacearchaeota archaeon]